MAACNPLCCVAWHHIPRSDYFMVIFSFTADGLMWLVATQILQEIRSRQFTFLQRVGKQGGWPALCVGQSYNATDAEVFCSHRKLWSWEIKRGDVPPRRLMWVGEAVTATDDDVVAASRQRSTSGAGPSGPLPPGAVSQRPD
jgi:hypothetical protein